MALGFLELTDLFGLKRQGLPILQCLIAYFLEFSPEIDWNFIEIGVLLK